MIGLLVIIVVGYLLYRFYKNTSQPSLTLSVTVTPPNEEAIRLAMKEDAIERAKLKNDGIKNLKNSFKKPESLDLALGNIEKSIKDFIETHGVDFAFITTHYKNLNIPNIILDKEIFLRKEIEKEYKKRNIAANLTKAIYLSCKHAKLQLKNPEEQWKNLRGIKILQTNLKTEEYFEALMGILSYTKDLLNHDETERLFELWHSRNQSYESYLHNLSQLRLTKTYSDKHFLLYAIIGYLSRRYQYNPTFKDELVARCRQDIELYEGFLMEFFKDDFVDIEASFIDDTELVVKNYTFKDVKKLEHYSPPSLNSFNVLQEIYKAENNQSDLKWLNDIGNHIKYGYDPHAATDTAP